MSSLVEEMLSVQQQTNIYNWMKNLKIREEPSSKFFGVIRQFNEILNTRVKWQYEVSTNVWQDFDRESTLLIEVAYQNGYDNDIQFNHFYVNIKNMTVWNELSYAIRRV